MSAMHCVCWPPLCTYAHIRPWLHAFRYWMCIVCMGIADGCLCNACDIRGAIVNTLFVNVSAVLIRRFDWREWCGEGKAGKVPTDVTLNENIVPANLIHDRISNILFFISHTGAVPPLHYLAEHKIQSPPTEHSTGKRAGVATACRRSPSQAHS